MENSNSELARFCISKVGVPYVMGMQGKVLTKDLYNHLVKWNPGKWFTLGRRLKVKTWIGQEVTDCHGLIEWFVREQSGAAYDTTADGAYLATQEKGAIESIPEQPGICVRYPGHVGVYIEGGYVVEARGFDYGVCITQLKSRPWTHWYRHNRIKYVDVVLPVPEPMQINGVTDRYLVVNITNGLYNTTRGNKIKPFVETIKQMIENGDTFKEIEEVIKKDGYTGASSTIRMYATRERKLIKEAKKNCQGKSEKIERKWLISLLYKPIDKIKKLSQGQVDRVIERYPEIGEIYDIVGAFKNTLFSKESDEIEKWMSDAEALDVETINSFVNGIRRDLSAVKKAIELDYNNGLAEGSVNKLKVIKRIMYGRSSFELLKAKLLRLELKRKIN